MLDNIDFPSIVNLEVDELDAFRFEDDAEYYGDKSYMTNSKLGSMNDDVHKFAAMLAGFETSKEFVAAFVTGRYAHVAAFEPEKLDDFAIYKLGNRPYKNNPFPTTGKWRKAWEDLAKERGITAEEAYDWVISEDEHDMYSTMADCFWQADGMKDEWGDATFEKAFVGYDPFGYGIPVKGKLDIVKTLDDGTTIVGDLKTTSKTVDDFLYSIKMFNYDAQAAMYMELTGADEFHLLPVSKKNYAVGQYIIKRDSYTFNNGLAKYRRSIDKYNRLFVEGNYSSKFTHKVIMD